MFSNLLKQKMNESYTYIKINHEMIHGWWYKCNCCFQRERTILSRVNFGWLRLLLVAFGQ